MVKISKTFALILTLIIATLILILMVEPVNAETTLYPTPSPEIPKPNVPQFTVNLIDSSYNIPASTSTDPYTGETKTQPSQHIEARTIEIKIKNEAFTPFEVKLGTSEWSANYQYNIRWKGHFEKDWHGLFLASDGYLGSDLESPETVFAPQGYYSSTEGLNMDVQGMYSTFPPDSQLDFQAQSMIGFVHRDYTGGWIFTGQTSDWSSTQTLNLADGSVSPSPTVPELSWLVILPLLVCLFSVAAVIRHRKNANLKL